MLTQEQLKCAQAYELNEKSGTSTPPSTDRTR